MPNPVKSLGYIKCYSSSSPRPVKSRSSKIACMVTTVHVACMQMVLHIHGNLCKVLIPLFKNNLNLSMCLSFLFCPVFGCLLLSITALSCSLPRCTLLIFVFVFTEADFVAQPINQTSLSQSKRQIYIHLTFQTEKISLNRSAGLTYKLYPHELRTIYALIEELSQCDKYWLSLPQVVNIASCFSPLVLSTCHN